MRARLLAGAAAAVLVLAGCTGGDGADGSPAPSSGPPAPSGAADTTDAAALAAKYLDATQVADPAPTPIGSADGSLTLLEGGTVGATAEALSVTTDGVATLLHWQITIDETKAVLKVGYTFNPDGQGHNTGGVELVDPATGTHYRTASRPHSAECLCSAVRDSDLSTIPYPLDNVFAPLPDSVTQVRVKVPHFPAMTVPVTRS